MAKPEHADNAICVAALYRFVDLRDERSNLRATADAIERRMEELAIRGTLILAEEGINGTIAGPTPAIDRMIRDLGGHFFAGKLGVITPSLSYCDAMPFERTVVKVRREIVTMGVPGTRPTEIVGQYVDPSDWNKLIDDPDVIVIDTRNDFEVEMGTFISRDGSAAINPRTVSFREFPDFVERSRASWHSKPIAMFCTGGIRCEKATSYLVSLGFRDVYHLRGGILGYLRDVDPSVSRWQGGCFVFDSRVAIGHGLTPLDPPPFSL